MSTSKKPLVKNVYFNEEKDSELIEWLNNSTNFSSMVRLMLYDKFNNEKRATVIQQTPYPTTTNSSGNSFKNNMFKNLKK